jgi:serine/threonine-protein kinase
MAPEMVVELRADNRSDLFSLGTVFYEMLAGERLFPGAGTAEVLEKVVAADIPDPPAGGRDLPEGVLAILRKALRRDPQQRFASAAEMGVACEHYLYDKGYGPTNLTLKHYLQALFGAGPAALRDGGEEMASIDPALLQLVEDTASGEREARPEADAQQTRRSIDRGRR